MKLRSMGLTMVALVTMIAACGNEGRMEYQKDPPKAADAKREKKAAPVVPAFIAALNNEDFQACRDLGLVFDRRKKVCMNDMKIASYPCDRTGIMVAFADTGDLIVQILDRSLGKIEKPGDIGEGFVIDQCGGSTKGKRLVFLLKERAGAAPLVREIEAK